jgi:SAM-dependent methyltransferase
VTEQRFVFDAVAQLYQRSRPGYPEALVEDALKLAEVRPPARLLELGSGTGHATEPFARRGYSVLCLEPGARMVKLARARFADSPRVAFEITTFEAWSPPSDRFDLVYCAQAFHWLDRETRFGKIRGLLRPGGSLAVFGNRPIARPGPLEDAIQDAYRRIAPSLAKPGAPGGCCCSHELESLEVEFAARGLASVTAREYPWSRAYPRDVYLELMRTQSDHCLLPDAQREALLGELGAAIDSFGGVLEVDYSAGLVLGRRP